MGTHPIFESDFDCLTEWPQQALNSSGRSWSPKRVSTLTIMQEISSSSKTSKSNYHVFKKLEPHWLGAHLTAALSWAPIRERHLATQSQRRDASKFTESLITFIAAALERQQIETKLRQ